jgi:hypothetical protein
VRACESNALIKAPELEVTINDPESPQHWHPDIAEQRALDEIAKSVNLPIKELFPTFLLPWV